MIIPAVVPVLYLRFMLFGALARAEAFFVFNLSKYISS